MIEQCQYSEIRHLIAPADVIAFGGTGRISNLIKFFTFSHVSHVGIILRGEEARVPWNDSTAPWEVEEPFDPERVQIIESTSLNGTNGVSISYFSKRLTEYDGRVWWLPMSKTIRNKLDLGKFYRFALEQEGKPYDWLQAILSAIPFIPHVENLGKEYCSELAAAMLEAGGAIKDVDASAVTPQKLCEFHMYHPLYSQLKGKRCEIRDYNTVEPNGWGT